MWKNIVEPGRPHDKMAYAHCMLDSEDGRHTQDTSYFLLFHCNSGCTNAPQCYAIHTKSVNKVMSWSVTAFSMFSTVPKWRPLRWNFSFGNENKSHGLRSGEYGGCGTTGMPFSAKNSITEIAVWQGALSWWSIQLSAMLGRTRTTLFLSLSRISR